MKSIPSTLGILLCLLFGLTACHQPQDWRKEVGSLEIKEGQTGVLVAYLQALKAKEITIERPKAWLSTEQNILRITLHEPKRLNGTSSDDWEALLQPLADAFWKLRERGSAIQELEITISQPDDYDQITYYLDGERKAHVPDGQPASGVESHDYYLEGLAFYEEGEMENATESFQYGLEADPEYSMNYIGLIDVAIYQEDFEAGESWLSAIKEKLNLDQEVFLAESRLALAQGDTDRSLEALDQTEKLNRFHEDLFTQRMDTYLQRGDTTQACYYYQGARQLQMEIDYYDFVLEDKCVHDFD